MSGWFSIKFSNTFVFPDPEPPIIDILYGVYGQFLLCSVLFSVLIKIVIKIDHLYVAGI